MTSMRIFGMIGALFFAPLLYGKSPDASATRAVCVAIAASGSSAAATLAGARLNLQITDISGHSNTLSVNLEIDADDCRIVFDTAGDLVAIAVRKQLNGGDDLRILVANTQTSAWVSNFGVEPRGGMHAPLSLTGFLADSKSLVVKSSGEKIGDALTSVGTIVLDFSGKTLDAAPFEREVAGNPQNQRDQFADSVNNRLWYLNYPQFCPIKSTSLTGDQSPGPSIYTIPGQADACDVPDTIAFPDRDTVVMAETRSDHDAVWRIDLKTHGGEEVLAPRGHFPRGDQVDGDGSVSPDGQIFAFARNQFSYGHLDNFRSKGGDIVVVQLHPLRVLGVVSQTGDFYQHAFAVDHRGDNTTVLVFSEGMWKRISIEAPKPGSAAQP